MFSCIGGGSKFAMHVLNFFNFREVLKLKIEEKDGKNLSVKILDKNILKR